MTATASGTRSLDLLNDLRRSTLFRECVPVESNLGWPIPRLRKNPDPAAYLTVPMFTVSRRAGEGLRLHAPHAQMTLGWPSGTIMAFTDHRYEAPWTIPGEPVGTFPHEGLPRDRDAYDTRRTAVHDLYDELLDHMAAGESMPNAWWRRFAGALRPLVEPGLLPYYRALGPRFFDRIVPEITETTESAR